ncbi:MAG TPA: ClpXP protease specificity-enhancing factor SspB [Xanthobacteraceae bacterium]|jgi:hypothetical protein
MPVDHIRYDILVQDALRGMVRNVLADTAKGGLAGDHHFFVTFDTTADGVKISDRLRERYPEEMTIVLQHQFWDMKVTDELFEVGLSFGGVAEKLVIPLAAIKQFADPAVQFTLQFETLPEAGDAAEGDGDAGTPREAAKPKLKSQSQPAGKDARPDAKDSKREPGRTSVPASPLPAAAGTETASAKTTSDKPGADQPADKSGGAEVVRLDRFRKK